MIREPELHFWARVTRSIDGCWNWTGSRSRDGYGRLGMRSVRSTTSHRAAYEFANGDIPEGAHVLHTCDNPACCRPSHLRLGTHADNMADMKAKGRGKSGMKPGVRSYERGWHHSESTKSKMRASLTGKKRTPEQIERMRVAQQAHYARKRAVTQ